MTMIAGGVTATRGPAHLWAVGALGLAWNGFGCFDFVMTNLRDPGYMAQLPPDMIDLVDAFPAWVILSWAMGVGCALLGSMLLLGRSAWAVTAFAFALLGLAASQFHQFAAGVPEGMNSAATWIMTAAIWIAAIVQLLYAHRMLKCGVLR